MQTKIEHDLAKSYMVRALLDAEELIKKNVEMLKQPHNTIYKLPNPLEKVRQGAYISGMEAALQMIAHARWHVEYGEDHDHQAIQQPQR